MLRLIDRADALIEGRAASDNHEAVDASDAEAIYELLETVTDRCEDVANIVEGIIVENA